MGLRTLFLGVLAIGLMMLDQNVVSRKPVLEWVAWLCPPLLWPAPLPPPPVEKFPKEGPFKTRGQLETEKTRREQDTTLFRVQGKKKGQKRPCYGLTKGFQ